MGEEGLAAQQAAPEQQASTGAGSQVLASDEPVQAEQPQQTQQQDTWYNSLKDESLRGWVEAKNYPDLDTAIRQAHNLEKMRGVPDSQIIKLPSERTPEAMRDVYTKLGAPADPSGYEFPDGTTEEQAAWFRSLAHQQGLTKEQARATYEGLSQTIGQAQSEAHEKFLVESQAEFEQLKRERGAEFEEFVRDGRKARQQLNLSDTEADALERSLGTKRFLELMANVGSRSREATFIDSDTGVQSFRAMSPAAARAKIDMLKGDKAWNDRRLSGDKGVQNEYINLLRLANGG